MSQNQRTPPRTVPLIVLKYLIRAFDIWIWLRIWKAFLLILRLIRVIFDMCSTLRWLNSKHIIMPFVTFNVYWRLMNMRVGEELTILSCCWCDNFLGWYKCWTTTGAFETICENIEIHTNANLHTRTSPIFLFPSASHVRDRVDGGIPENQFYK